MVRATTLKKPMKTNHLGLNYYLGFLLMLTKSNKSTYYKRRY